LLPIDKIKRHWQTDKDVPTRSLLTAQFNDSDTDFFPTWSALSESSRGHNVMLTRIKKKIYVYIETSLLSNPLKVHIVTLSEGL
jgi:hypothetical protein